MKACITGATGCVGRNLVEELLKDGWEVIVLHRSSSDLSKLAGLDLTFAEVNLAEPESVRSAIPEDLDAVFHLAANVSHWAADLEQQYQDNVIATRNLARVALEKKVKRFIFASTGAAAKASMPSRIYNGYVHTKKQSEDEVNAAIKDGLDAVILRLPIVVGKYDYNNYSQIFSELKNGLFKFSFPGKLVFAHATDIARGHIQAFHKGKSGETYYFGGELATWYDVFCHIAKLLEVKAPPKPFPLPVFYTMAFCAETVSKFTKKSPFLTRELLFLLNGGDSDPDIRGFEEGKDVSLEIGYQSRSLDAALEDCYTWLQKENRI